MAPWSLEAPATEAPGGGQGSSAWGGWRPTAATQPPLPPLFSPHGSAERAREKALKTPGLGFQLRFWVPPCRTAGRLLRLSECCFAPWNWEAALSWLLRQRFRLAPGLGVALHVVPRSSPSDSGSIRLTPHGRPGPTDACVPASCRRAWS